MWKKLNCFKTMFFQFFEDRQGRDIDCLAFIIQVPKIIPPKNFKSFYVIILCITGEMSMVGSNNRDIIYPTIFNSSCT